MPSCFGGGKKKKKKKSTFEKLPFTWIQPLTPMLLTSTFINWKSLQCFAFWFEGIKPNIHFWQC